MSSLMELWSSEDLQNKILSLPEIIKIFGGFGKGESFLKMVL
jgi:hypothetical protein